MIGAAKPFAGPRTPRARSLRILVLEDDAIIGMLLAEMLEEMGQRSARSRPPKPVQSAPQADANRS